jgi:hypothetical protein
VSFLAQMEIEVACKCTTSDWKRKSKGVLAKEHASGVLVRVDSSMFFVFSIDLVDYVHACLFYLGCSELSAIARVRRR